MYSKTGPEESSEPYKFLKEWEEQFFFTDVKAGAVCLLCFTLISKPDREKLQTHHDSVHEAFIKGYPFRSGMRRRKLVTAISTLDVNSKLIGVSLRTACILASAKRPFTDSELIRDCIKVYANNLYDDNTSSSIFENIPLSINAMKQNFHLLYDEVMFQLKNDVDRCIHFSLLLDEASNFTYTDQLLIYIKMIFADCSTKVSLLTYFNMNELISGGDIFQRLKQLIIDENIQISKLTGIMTDDSPSMCGDDTSFISLCNSDMDFPNFVHYHSVSVHLENRCGNVLLNNYSHILDVVMIILNSLKGIGFQREDIYKSLFNELELEGRRCFQTNVRWLLMRGNILKGFFELLPEIRAYFSSGDVTESYVEVNDRNWLMDLAFLTDLTIHVNDLVDVIKNEDSIIKMKSEVYKFESNLELWSAQIKSNCYNEFPSLGKIICESSEMYRPQKHVDHLNLFRAEFNRRHQSLTWMSSTINFLQHPFSNHDLEELAAAMKICTSTNQLDTLTELDLFMEDDTLKYIENRDGNLWKAVSFLRYPNIRKCAYKMRSLFGSSDVCEKGFSNLNLLTFNCKKLLDFDLKNYMMLISTPYEPNILRIVKKNFK